MEDLDLQNTVTHSLVKYRNHLEFAGYKIKDEEEDCLIGLHPRKTNLYLEKIGERGVLVSTVYDIKDNVGRTSLLEFINTLNAEFLFMKAYLNDEELIIETFFEGDYDRTNFSILLENIDSDMNVFFGHQLTEEYIG